MAVALAVKLLLVEVSRVQSTIVGGVFIVIGCANLVWMCWALVTSWQSAHWPSVTGKIITSSVGETSDTDGGRWYYAKVTYTFFVEEQEFRSSRVVFGDFSFWPFSYSRSERVVRKYRSGSDVRVFYSPSNPRQAVLEPGVSVHIFLVGLFGAVCLPLGIGAAASAA